jgi:uncharacterized membrane-anchored protein
VNPWIQYKQLDNGSKQIIWATAIIFSVTELCALIVAGTTLPVLISPILTILSIVAIVGGLLYLRYHLQTRDKQALHSEIADYLKGMKDV